MSVSKESPTIAVQAGFEFSCWQTIWKMRGSGLCIAYSPLITMQSKIPSGKLSATERTLSCCTSFGPFVKIPNLKLHCFNFSRSFATGGVMLKPACRVLLHRLLHWAAILDGSIWALSLLSAGMFLSTASHHISKRISWDDFLEGSNSTPEWRSVLQKITWMKERFGGKWNLLEGLNDLSRIFKDGVIRMKHLMDLVESTFVSTAGVNQSVVQIEHDGRYSTQHHF